MENKGYTTSIDIPVTPEFKAQVADRARSLGMKTTEWARKTLEWAMENQVLDSQKGQADNDRPNS